MSLEPDPIGDFERRHRHQQIEQPLADLIGFINDWTANGRTIDRLIAADAANRLSEALHHQ